MKGILLSSIVGIFGAHAIPNREFLQSSDYELVTREATSPYTFLPSEVLSRRSMNLGSDFLNTGLVKRGGRLAGTPSSSPNKPTFGHFGSQAHSDPAGDAMRASYAAWLKSDPSQTGITSHPRPPPSFARPPHAMLSGNGKPTLPDKWSQYGKPSTFTKPSPNGILSGNGKPLVQPFVKPDIGTILGQHKIVKPQRPSKPQGAGRKEDGLVKLDGPSKIYKPTGPKAEGQKPKAGKLRPRAYGPPMIDGPLKIYPTTSPPYADGYKPKADSPPRITSPLNIYPTTIPRVRRTGRYQTATQQRRKVD